MSCEFYFKKKKKMMAERMREKDSALNLFLSPSVSYCMSFSVEVPMQNNFHGIR